MQHTSLITVRMPASVAKRLKKLADSMDRSKSYVAVEAIEQYLDYQEWKIEAIQEGLDAIDRGEVMDWKDVKKLLLAKEK